MIWDRNKECLPHEEIVKLQERRLKTLVKYLYTRVPFYKNAFDEKGVKPKDVRSLSFVSELPFTTKADLRDHYPYGLFAALLHQIVEIHASSGTTGRPIVVGYTRNDIDNWGEAMARTMTACGVSFDDIVQNAYGYGLFTGGLGAHYGSLKIGAAVVPISGGQTEKQIMLLSDFRSTVICSTPSFSLHMAEVAESMGVNIRELPIRVGIFGAEPWTKEMRHQIEERWGIKAFDIYGLTEITGPGVSFECSEHNGLHINEDLFYPEIIDPVTLKPLPDGEFGELVFTTLVKEGAPFLRYRTRDLTRLVRSKCECGRTLVKMDRVSGRSDDMLIIRGVNVFPSQIESVLLSIKETLPHYLIIVKREGAMDALEIKVECKQEVLKAGKDKIDEVAGKIVHKIKDIIGISVKINLVEPSTIERSVGKAKRVLDERAKNSH